MRSFLFEIQFSRRELREHRGGVEKNVKKKKETGGKFLVRGALGNGRIRMVHRGSVELVSQALRSTCCCPGSKDEYERPSKTFN